MRASLDTNVVIHFYRANLQDILFDFLMKACLSMSKYEILSWNIMVRTYWKKLILILQQER